MRCQSCSTGAQKNLAGKPNRRDRCIAHVQRVKVNALSLRLGRAAKGLKAERAGARKGWRLAGQLAWHFAPVGHGPSFSIKCNFAFLLTVYGMRGGHVTVRSVHCRNGHGGSW